MHFFRISRLSLISICALVLAIGASCSESGRKPFASVRTIAGANGEFGETFGIAVSGDKIFVSDGEKGQVSTIAENGTVTEFAAGLDTPSGLALDSEGRPIVADAGRNAIYRLDPAPTVIAGVPGERGDSDGAAATAKFNGPTSLAVDSRGRIIVADTYNDRIRVIENGSVSTLAGGIRGYADGIGCQAQFDTPLGVAAWGERILVADAGNRRLRVIEPDGRVWTLAGSGSDEVTDGLPLAAAFARPTGVTVGPDGAIYISDANTIRAIGRRTFAFVETIAGKGRGFRDGAPLISRFNRPSGIAFDNSGRLLVADSDNAFVRAFDAVPPSQDAPKLKPREYTAEEFRNLQPPRWPYDPPEAKHDIAGTLGEVRGTVTDQPSSLWFHSGLDIAGAYGETARAVRTEKVLDPISTANFGTLRELIRMPLMGYIHLRLGRDQNERPFDDPRFIFSYSDDGKMNDVRVPRGVAFKAGDAIGTLNPMNHVHLIAGPSGEEMNALAALTLPNVSDAIAPTIEKVQLFDANWNEIETGGTGSRITLTGQTRVVVRAFDRMDGNPERRRLGVYRLGYQIIPANGDQHGGEIDWTITFDRDPPSAAVRTVYAKASHSGATGETIFNYIVSNRLSADGYSEGFIDPKQLGAGQFILRVFAADIFGNQTSRDISIEVKNQK